MDAVGFDFGTTNSAVAIATGDSRVRLASYSTDGAEIAPFRSVLYFEQGKSVGAAKRIIPPAGWSVKV